MSVLGLCCRSSFLVLWFFIVVGTISLSGWLKLKATSSSVVSYFIVSALGGLLYLLGSSSPFAQSQLVCLALFLKLGLFPFHFWVLKVLVGLSPLELCLFLGPMKLGLLFLLVSSAPTSLFLPTLSLFWGTYLIFISGSLSLLLYSSGSCLVLWLVLLGPHKFSQFYITYLLRLTTVALCFLNLFSPIIAFLSLGGLPPLPFFWGKLLSITLLPLAWSFFVVFFSCLLFFPYLSFALCMPSRATTPFFSLVMLCAFSWYLVSLPF